MFCIVSTTFPQDLQHRSRDRRMTGRRGTAPGDRPYRPATGGPRQGS